MSRPSSLPVSDVLQNVSGCGVPSCTKYAAHPKWRVGKSCARSPLRHQAADDLPAVAPVGALDVDRDGTRACWSTETNGCG
jgi:hypothetical protein